MSWIQRRGFAQVIDGLLSRASGQELPEVRWLRSYSNYLTPWRGLLSTDMWTMWTTYVLNGAVNLILLMALLTTGLLILRLGPAILEFLKPAFDYPLQFLQAVPELIAPSSAFNYQALVCLFLVAVGIAFIALNLGALARRDKDKPAATTPDPWYMRSRALVGLIVLPIALAAWLGSLWLWKQYQVLAGPWLPWSIAGSVVYSSSWLLGGFLVTLAGFLEKKLGEKPHKLTVVLGSWVARGWVIILLMLNFVVTSGSAISAAKFKDLLNSEAALPVVFGTLFVTLIFAVFELRRKKTTGRVQGLSPGFSWRTWVGIIITAVFAGFLGGFLVWGFPVAWSWMSRWFGSAQILRAQTSIGAPLLLLVFVTVGAVHNILMSEYVPGWLREWLGRLGAMFLLCALGWAFLFGIALHSEALLQGVSGGLQRLPSAALGALSLTGSSDSVIRVLLWLLTTGAGVLAAKRVRVATPRVALLARGVVVVGSLVFVVGLLMVISAEVERVLKSLISFLGSPMISVGSWTGLPWFLHLLFPSPELLAILLGIAFCSFLAFVLSFLVDINEFSMQPFYRNRLVRCYLGASNRPRTADPHTGLDPRDDLFLASLMKPDQGCSQEGYSGLYPILNATLSLTRATELAWQTRKGGPFVFTPAYCGYTLPARLSGSDDEQGDDCYRSTEDFGGGITLGQAMATSGAAVTPSRGYQASGAAAFLLTVFNLRLGSWMGNPSLETWRERSPAIGLYYLAKELSGRMDTSSEFVYVSDGGHFENLGLYELVRRRCPRIVACDVEQDEDTSFGGLGNAIEKCREDFGIDIEIDVSGIRRKRDGEENHRSEQHCAVGTIHYERIDPRCPAGTLLYFKASLTGDEPVDVLRYAEQNPEFPHQTTADQWFDETQFESYRKLGEHVVESLTALLEGEQRTPGKADVLFGKMVDSTKQERLKAIVELWGRGGVAQVGQSPGA